MASISGSGTQQTADPPPPGPAVCGVMCASSVHSHSRQQRAWRLAEGCCQETGCLNWSADRSAGLPEKSPAAAAAASQQCCRSLGRVTNLTAATADTFQILSFGTDRSFWSHFLSYTLVVLAELLSADIRVRSTLNSFFAHVQTFYAVVFTALCLTFTGMEFLLSHCWCCVALVMMHLQDYGNTKCQLRQNVSFLCMSCSKVQIFSEITEPYKFSPCPRTTFWRSILILSYHLRLSLPSSLFPSGLPTKTFLSLTSVPYVWRVLSADICHLREELVSIFRRKQVWNMAVMVQKYTHTHTHTLKKHTVFMLIARY